MRLKTKIHFSLITALVVGLIIISLMVVVEGMGYLLVVRDPLKSADVVAVLSGGGPERLEYATELVNEHYSRKLVLTETGEIDPNTGGKISQSMSKDAIDEGVKKKNQYIAGKNVVNTKDEAEVVLKLATQRGWDSVIVVTDTFHSLRTKIIFTDVFRGSGIKIRVNPVDVEGYWYKPGTWWTDSDSRRATITEYLSLASYYLGIYK